MTKLMAKWTLAVLMVLGALFAPFSSPVSASEPTTEQRHRLNGVVLPSVLVSDEYESDVADVSLPDLAVGSSVWVEAREGTRVNLPYDVWVKTTHYIENKAGSMTLQPILGYKWASRSGMRVKITRTETGCTMDIRGSSILWTSANVLTSGIERPYWDGPESTDKLSWWKVERVVHDELPHPVFHIPPHQIPLSRRGTPLWRQKLGDSSFAPWSEVHVLPEGRAWVDCTTVTRSSRFRDASGLYSMKIELAGEAMIAGIRESGFCVKVEIPKGIYYPPRPKEDAGVGIVNSISRVNNVSQGARFIRLQVWQFEFSEPEGPSASLRPVSDKR